MMDANEDINDAAQPMARLFHDLGMQDIMGKRHPHLRGVASFHKGTRHGSRQIDVIAATPEIYASSATWLAIHRSPGDHLAAVVDIKWQVLIGEELLQIARPAGRRLTGRLPKTQRKYNEYVEQQLHQHNVMEKYERILLNLRHGMLSDLDRLVLDSLDRTKTDVMTASEKRCRKLRMGEIDFSPQVSQLKQTRDTWALIVRRPRGKRVSSSLIKRRAKSSGIRRPLSRTLMEAEQEYKQAVKSWEAVKPQAPLLRREFLKEVAKKIAKRERKDETAVYRRLVSNDNQVKAYRLLKHVLKRQQGRAVSKVQTPGPGGEVVEHEGQEAVEAALQAALTARFTLTNDTPGMQEPLRSLLGRGDTEVAKQILEGTYECPEDMDEGSKLFINQEPQGSLDCS